MTAKRRTSIGVWFRPALLAGAFLLVVGALLWLVHADEKHRRAEDLADSTQSVRASIRLRLRGNEDYLLLLAEARSRDALSAEEFRQRADRYVAAHPELINVTWVDASYVIRDVAPLAGNRQIVGLTLTLPEPKRVARLARERQAPVYTRPFEAIQGRPSFEVWVPVFRGGEFTGLFAGVYSCVRLLQETVPSESARRHHFELRDDAGALLGELPQAGTPDPGWHREVELSPPGQGVTLRLQSYGPGAGPAVLLLLGVLSGALALGMGYSLWALKKDGMRRQQAKEDLRKLNRALRAVSACNQALIHASDEGQLLSEICRIVVDVGGYRLAWVGYAEPDEARTIRPMARAGSWEGYLETLDLSWADTERGRGPTGTAIRTDRACVVQDIQRDPRFLPWRPDALRHGFASLVSLPLRMDGRVFGAFNVSAAQPDAFDAEEVTLLGELADDLAYGIRALRTRAAHQEAETALRESEERLRALGDNLPDSYVYQYTLEADGTPRFLYVSAGMERLHGVKAQDVLREAGVLQRQIAPQQRAALTAAEGDSGSTLVDFESELRMPRLDGPSRWLQVRSRPRRTPEGRVLWDGVATDITARKEAEAHLAEQLDELRRWHQATLGREGRVLQLKKEVNELLAQAGQPPRYRSAVEGERE
jgi:PAS domain S-box-containing protein